jgi:histidinol-phosphate aminotransferase
MQAAAEQVAAPPAEQQQPSPTQFLRPHLLKLAPYTPIEPFEVLSARYGRSPQDIVKLDANENPYGPPPEVLEALAKMPFPHIYPDPETRRLRAALAEWNNVPAEHLLVSAAVAVVARLAVVRVLQLAGRGEPCAGADFSCFAIAP